ncbi:Hpt domain-containing protein [Aliiroseovarius sp. S2029]|uniref:Hpt domain-containing protein n=1 Tax=Aliiroseovarius sp. S2029 TaxID=2936988 RepID=UPI0020BDC39F|nr:Hpt domain-containing protein [Aliiroseovarius sp. S2029]MCK8485521.1 Hpt domain-containing protein [Aliiroseovarius sp. S2029]
MESTDHTALNDAIISIQAKYLRSLDQHLEHFSNLLTCIDTDQEAAHAIVKIKERAHRIYGLAGTIGLEQLGENAKQVEITAAKLDQATTKSRAQSEELASLVEGLLDYIKDLQHSYLGPSDLLP